MFTKLYAGSSGVASEDTGVRAAPNPSGEYKERKSDEREKWKGKLR